MGGKSRVGKGGSNDSGLVGGEHQGRSGVQKDAVYAVGQSLMLIPLLASATIGCVESTH